MFAQEPFIKYRSLLFAKEISSERMGNGKWENEEWEIENERINLFFSIYCLIWGIRHFSAVIIVLFGQKKITLFGIEIN